jgi:hypothetical protein
MLHGPYLSIALALPAGAESHGFARPSFDHYSLLPSVQISENVDHLFIATNPRPLSNVHLMNRSWDNPKSLPMPEYDLESGIVDLLLVSLPGHLSLVPTPRIPKTMQSHLRR